MSFGLLSPARIRPAPLSVQNREIPADLVQRGEAIAIVVAGRGSPPFDAGVQSLDRSRKRSPGGGRLPAEAAARMEAAWADPCRAWEPDSAPWATPLLRPDAGSRARVRECPGSAPVIAEITEAGRAPRLIFYPCNMPFSTDRLITMTAFARPDGAEAGG